MPRGILPGLCSRLRVFVNYAHEQRILREEIAQTLKNAGHTVFFDRDILTTSAEYNDCIRNEVVCSDRFVFLASKGIIRSGSVHIDRAAICEGALALADRMGLSGRG